MADISRGLTFGASETVTNTKLHNLVDDATITNIVNADIDSAAAIADTKLGDITTGNKVRGTSFGNLPSIPSGAGLIPSLNIPILGSTMVSLVSIPNASLQPITLASWVDGVALRNLASTPVDQQIRYNLLVSSLASGAFPAYNGANNFVGKLFDIMGSRVYAHTPAAGNPLTNPITWSEVIDANGDFSSGTFTAPRAGHYFVSTGWGANDGSGTGNMNVALSLSNVTLPLGTHKIVTGDSNYVSFSALVSMAASGTLGVYTNIYNTLSPTTGHLVILGPLS